MVKMAREDYKKELIKLGVKEKDLKSKKERQLLEMLENLRSREKVVNKEKKSDVSKSIKETQEEYKGEDIKEENGKEIKEGSKDTSESESKEEVTEVLDNLTVKNAVDIPSITPSNIKEEETSQEGSKDNSEIESEEKVEVEVIETSTDIPVEIPVNDESVEEVSETVNIPDESTGRDEKVVSDKQEESQEPAVPTSDLNTEVELPVTDGILEETIEEEEEVSTEEVKIEEKVEVKPESQEEHLARRKQLYVNKTDESQPVKGVYGGHVLIPAGKTVRYRGNPNSEVFEEVK